MGNIADYDYVTADNRDMELITRKSEWKTNKEYFPGIGSDEYLDLVKFKNNANWYRCIVHHKSGVFEDDLSVGYWKALSWLENVATDLMLARKILADEIDVENLIAKRLQTARTGPRVEIEDSLMTFFGQFGKNIEIGVDKSGYAVLTYYNNDGTKLYDLGPHGLDWGTIKPASWTTVRLAKICNIIGDPGYNDFVSEVPSFWDVIGVKDVTASSGEDYYKYYAGSNPTITPEQREPEKYIYCGNYLGSEKLPNGWYVIPEGDHPQYKSSGTHQFIKPVDGAIYEYSGGVIDRDPIYFSRLIEYRGGQLIRRVMVFWNGGGGIV